MSAALVEGDRRAQAAALRVIKRHFKPGSELLRELRLVRSLVRTTVSSDAVAASIMGEAKAASRGFDHVKLEREKGELLRSIARTFRDEAFFEAPIADYKAYATVQTLVNEWRDPHTADLGRQARYEDELVRMLIEQKKPDDDRLLNAETPGTNRLVAHIMTRRLNEKYAGQLDQDQRDLVRSYAFAGVKGDGTALRKRLADVRTSVMTALDRFCSESRGNAGETAERLDEARRVLAAETFEQVDDACVGRMLSCLRIRSEIDGTARPLAEGAGSAALDEHAPRLLVSSPEFVERASEMVKESRRTNDGRIILGGILQKADTLNQNGRVYPRSILEREIRNYQKFINERRATGELDHPDSSVISLKNVSHKVIEAVMDAQGVVRGRVEILNTPSGKILQDLLEGDVKLGISSRGVGSTRKQGDYVVVQDDFQLICWDFVSEPSTPGAFMLPEGKAMPWQMAEGRVLTRVERIDRLISELLVR